MHHAVDLELEYLVGGLSGHSIFYEQHMVHSYIIAPYSGHYKHFGSQELNCPKKTLILFH